MSLLVIFLFLIIGFAFVIKGADWLVDGASSLAKKMKISDLVIGLTIVSFGTSTPELVVNLFASFQGNADIAIGNVLGSNIANIFVILGISAVIYPLAVTKGTAFKEIPFSLLAAITVGLMANDVLFDGRSTSAITRIDGFVLISFFIIFMYYIFGISKNKGANSEAESTKEYKTYVSIILILVGIAGLVIGGKLVVDNAVSLATMLGISTSLVGLTIVAVGTSLPELATSAVAAYKKNVDIAVGNVVGSNIFNIFWILGLSAIIRPLPFNVQSNGDILVTIAASILLFLFLFVGKRHIIERWQGVLFLTIYAFYVIYLVINDLGVSVI